MGGAPYSCEVLVVFPLRCRASSSPNKAPILWISSISASRWLAPEGRTALRKFLVRISLPLGGFAPNQGARWFSNACRKRITPKQRTKPHIPKPKTCAKPFWAPAGRFDPHCQPTRILATPMHNFICGEGPFPERVHARRDCAEPFTKSGSN